VISQSRFINIISGVGAGAAVAVRNLGMRIITQNTALPPGVVAEFSGSQMASSVSSYFGATSEEYKRASAYAGFVSKSISSPTLISFARWVNTAIAPSVIGDTTTKNLAALQAVTAGTLSVLDGTSVIPISSINLSTATTLTQVASLIQTALRTALVGTISAPTLTTPTTSTTGGTLAAATYYYKATWLNANGETNGSNEVSVTTTGTTSSNTLAIPAAPAGATSGKVYRGTSAGGESVYFTITTSQSTFVDTGAAGTAGTVPASNTTGAADPQLASATVTYNTNTNQYVLTGSITGTGSLSVVLGGQPPVSTDIAGLLGWGTTGTVNVPGQAAQTALQAVQATTAISNNFGSFIFVTGLASALQQSDYTAISNWNATQNNQYVFSIPVTMANLSAMNAAVVGNAGTCLNLLSSTLPNDYIEQSPCEIIAATNYSQRQASQNFMFYQFPNRNVTVTDDTTANTVDSYRCNYIGQTQFEGTNLAFYQRGVLCGNTQTAPTDINTYANEMWLKSDIASGLMTFFLAIPEVSADADGAGQISGVIQQSVNRAVLNGTIVAGKTLTNAQQVFVTQQSGDPNAWRQVQTIGYWFTVTFSSQVNSNNGLTEWFANYILIYAKNDAIRSVQGQDILM
jgi:hypothetical protein